MTVQNITLIGAAAVFGVHPRTIVRALSGEHNTYWTEDIDEEVFSVRDIANAYNMDEADLSRCIERRDRMLTPDEAAYHLGIKPRTFRERVRQGVYQKITNGGIVRYLHSKIVEDKIRRAK